MTHMYCPTLHCWDSIESIAPKTSQGVLWFLMASMDSGRVISAEKDAHAEARYVMRQDPWRTGDIWSEYK